MLFDNPVSKVQTMLEAMNERGVVPECEYVMPLPRYYCLLDDRMGRALGALQVLRHGHRPQHQHV